MTTEAGKRLLLGLPDRGTGLVAINTESLTEAIAAIEAEAIAAERARITREVEAMRWESLGHGRYVWKSGVRAIVNPKDAP